MADADLTEDGCTITIVLPLTVRKRGGRKLVVSPADEEQWVLSTPRKETTLIKAIARANRWQQLLQSGDYATAEDIAKPEKISASYISRMLQLTLLSPAIVEMVLDGRQSAAMTTTDLMPMSAEWRGQRMVRG